MSQPIEWEIFGKHQDGTPLSSREIEALVALDEGDFEGADFGTEDELFCEMFTESAGAHMRMEAALTEYARMFPDICLTVLYRYDTAWNPDGYITKDGRLLEITGHVTYTLDETGEEVLV
jgi:hypothetical protein